MSACKQNDLSLAMLLIGAICMQAHAPAQRIRLAPEDAPVSSDAVPAPGASPGQLLLAPLAAPGTCLALYDLLQQSSSLSTWLSLLVVRASASCLHLDAS